MPPRVRAEPDQVARLEGAVEAIGRLHNSMRVALDDLLDRAPLSEDVERLKYDGHLYDCTFRSQSPAERRAAPSGCNCGWQTVETSTELVGFVAWLIGMVGTSADVASIRDVPCPDPNLQLLDRFRVELAGGRLLDVLVSDVIA